MSSPPSDRRWQNLLLALVFLFLRSINLRRPPHMVVDAHVGWIAAAIGASLLHTSYETGACRSSARRLVQDVISCAGGWICRLRLLLPAWREFRAPTSSLLTNRSARPWRSPPSSAERLLDLVTRCSDAASYSRGVACWAAHQVAGWVAAAGADDRAGHPVPARRTSRTRRAHC